MSNHVPLSLRRKLVIALDPNHVLASTVPIVDDADGAETAASNRFLSFKTLAWIKANIIRPTQDHVFLVTAVDVRSGALDANIISTMWNSMTGDEDVHTDRLQLVETELRRLAQALNRVGVSVSTEVLMGAANEKIPEYVHDHKGELLLIQAPDRSGFAATLSYSWADLCAHSAACPAVLIKKSDLPDNIAVALDPPLPTATVEPIAPPEAE
ncbi:hypothetical protein GGI12_004994 [Dipsacomyces acuminosporus]|nr:hypothetical protein GGI12_004994 [Dipsacomyces acuminosporus]